MEPTWHDGLSRNALVEIVEGLLMAPAVVPQIAQETSPFAAIRS